MYSRIEVVMVRLVRSNSAPRTICRQGLKIFNFPQGASNPKAWLTQAIQAELEEDLYLKLFPDPMNITVACGFARGPTQEVFVHASAGPERIPLFQGTVAACVTHHSGSCRSGLFGLACGAINFRPQV